MPKGNPLEYLNDVLKHEHVFLKYLEREAISANVACEIYTAKVKAGVSSAEAEGMAQIINYIEILPPPKKEGFLRTIRENVKSTSDDIEAGIYETIFYYSDGTIQIVDVVKTLTSQSYTASTDATLIKVIVGQHVKVIGTEAFRHCSSLTSIIIPDSVTAIKYGAFYDCISLASIVIPNSVKIIGDWAFAGCTSLTSITIPGSVDAICIGTFYNSGLESVTIQDGVTTIENKAFNRCISLTSATIPNSVTTINKWAFNCCASLTSVNIPNSVTMIDEWAFNGCTSLTSIDIPDSVTTIGGWAFDHVKHISYHGPATSNNQWGSLNQN